MSENNRTLIKVAIITAAAGIFSAVIGKWEIIFPVQSKNISTFEAVTKDNRTPIKLNSKEDAIAILATDTKSAHLDCHSNDPNISCLWK